MLVRFSLAAAAAVIGIAVLSTPAFAVMQVIQLPDPSAPASLANTPPDGLFDKSFSDHWQNPSSNGSGNSSGTGASPFHFTVNGASSGFTGTGNPSAIETSKQAGSEFYQPMPGYSFP